MIVNPHRTYQKKKTKKNDIQKWIFIKCKGFMDPGARSYDRWRHVKSLCWNKTKGSHYFSFDWIIYGEKTRKHLQYFIINIKTSRFKIISHFGSMLNLCCYPPAMPSNAWHLPLAPLNMSDRMEYVNCACNFKTTGHSVIFAIMGALSPSWSENLPGRALTHTHTHTHSPPSVSTAI